MPNTRLEKARDLLGSMISTAKVALQGALDTIPPPPPEPDLDDVVDDAALPVRTQKMAELLIQQGQLRAGAKMFDELAEHVSKPAADALREARAHALSAAVARREGSEVWTLPKHAVTPMGEFEVTRLVDEHEVSSLRLFEISNATPGKIRVDESFLRSTPTLWVRFPTLSKASVLALVDDDHIASVLRLSAST